MTNLTIDINCCTNLDSAIFDDFNTPVQWINMDSKYSLNNTKTPEWYNFRLNHFRSYAYSNQEDEIIINNFVKIINNYIIVLNLKNEYSQMLVDDFINQNYGLYKLNFTHLTSVKEKFKLKYSHP